MVLRLALIDILIALAPIALGLWILPHTAGWGRYWLRLFMTAVFQQAVQIIALAWVRVSQRPGAHLGLRAGPGPDLEDADVLAFVYLATRVPTLLGHHGTFDAWLHTLYFGLSLPGSAMRSARALALVGGPAGAAAAAATGAGAAQPTPQPVRRRPPLPPRSPVPRPGVRDLSNRKRQGALSRAPTKPRELEKCASSR